MGKTYTVAPGCEFDYPADPESLRIITTAGGRSKLTDDQKEIVKYKTVKEGEDCSDMPSSSLELYLSRGWIIDPDAPVEGTKGEDDIDEVQFEKDI